MRKELDIDWEKELGDSNPIDMLNKVMEKLNKTIDKNIPKSKPRNTKGSILLSKETVQNIKRKHRLWEKYMEDRSKEKHREYCKARNKVKRLTRRGRKEREKQVAESAKTNNKNFWKFVNLKRKTKTGVSELHDKSESGTFIASSDGDKAEILANCFSSVFTDEDVHNLPKLEKKKQRYSY
jgi:hypothetical protein